MLFYLFMLTAMAGDDEPKVTYKKETEIDFEAIELEGQLVKPQGALLLERKRASFNPLITLRKDFDKEIGDSIMEIK
jgi:hypothetical protein|tara:strand:- start:192 stop:422 length:231 start_codon:yes stop_codon:yes gene_type:complete